MSLNELEIIERTAQAKCGSSYIISLDPLKEVNGEKSILLRIQDKGDLNIIIPCVLPEDSTLGDICEMSEALIEELKELADM